MNLTSCLCLIALATLQGQAQTPAPQAQVSKPEAGSGSVDYVALQAEVQAIFDKANAEYKAYKASSATAPFKLDEQLLASIRSQVETSTGERKDAYLITEVSLSAKLHIKPKYQDRLFKEVSPASNGWKAALDVASELEAFCGKEAAPYQAKLREQGIPQVKAWIFGTEAVILATEKGDEAGAKAALAKALALAPDDPDMQVNAKIVDGVFKVPVGKPAPPFTVPDLEQEGKTYTLADFKGKFLLLDFWGTWCVWCVKELPNTHKVYERFKGKGFEILSLAKEAKAESVMAFRKKPGSPMPWKHGFLGPTDGRMVVDYGVTSYPTLILIGPDGTVLAKGNSLREAGLEKTLETFIK